MLELETKRLRAIALEEKLLELSVSPPALERALGLPESGFDIPPELAAEMRAGVDAALGLMRARPLDWMWITTWQVVHKEEQRIIGAIQFNGPPDDTGQVQIGFLIQGLYQGEGFMSELLPAVTHWVLSQPAVRVLAAQTATDNAPAQKVLSRAGFHRAAEDAHSIWWAAAVPED